MYGSQLAYRSSKHFLLYEDGYPCVYLSKEKIRNQLLLITLVLFLLLRTFYFHLHVCFHLSIIFDPGPPKHILKLKIKVN